MASPRFTLDHALSLPWIATDTLEGRRARYVTIDMLLGRYSRSALVLYGVTRGVGCHASAFYRPAAAQNICASEKAQSSALVSETQCSENCSCATVRYRCSIPGIVVAAVSVVFMPLLASAKRRVWSCRNWKDSAVLSLSIR